MTKPSFRSFLLLFFLFSINSLSAQVDLNDPVSFYGNWEGTVTFKSFAVTQEMSMEIQKGQQPNTVKLIIFHTRGAQVKNDTVQCPFENGVIKLVFGAKSVTTDNDFCRGFLNLSLLDEKNLNGSFESEQKGCTAVEYSGTRKERTTDVKKENSQQGYNNNKMETAKQEEQPLSNTDENAAVKNAAIAFYKWYETKWHKQQMPKIKQVIYDKAGKAYDEEEGSSCPCTIKQAVLDNYILWIKNNAPLISTKYLSGLKKLAAETAPKIKSGSADPFIYSFNTRYFSFISDYEEIFPEELDKAGFYNGKAMWNISINAEGTATVNTTFTSPFFDDNRKTACKIEMVKENGVWKLASPIAKGIIQTGARH